MTAGKLKRHRQGEGLTPLSSWTSYFLRRLLWRQAISFGCAWPIPQQGEGRCFNGVQLAFWALARHAVASHRFQWRPFSESCMLQTDFVGSGLPRFRVQPRNGADLERHLIDGALFHPRPFSPGALDLCTLWSQRPRNATEPRRFSLNLADLANFEVFLRSGQNFSRFSRCTPLIPRLSVKRATVATLSVSRLAPGTWQLCKLSAAALLGSLASWVPNG